MTTPFGAVLLRRYEAFFADPLFRAFVGDSGYANYGYWTPETATGEQACDHLVDRLLGDTGAEAAPALDVACGQGGTTRRLGRRLGAGRVLAVNLSPGQLRAARDRAPAAWLACADAARLPLAPASVRTVLCVEAAFHFETRERFLREAARVLVPGGRLLLADILARRTAGRIPAANLVRTPQAYRALLRAAGFTDLELEDATAATWLAFRRRYARFALARQGLGALLRSAPRLPWLLVRYLVTQRAMVAYVLVRARRSR